MSCCNSTTRQSDKFHEHGHHEHTALITRTGMASSTGGDNTVEGNTEAPIPLIHDLDLAGSANREMVYYPEDQVQLGNDRRSISVANCSYVNIAVGNTDYPGCVVKETLELMIKDAAQNFVETRAYQAIKQKLDEHNCITISGAPGEGKTSLALMLAASYRTRGYEVFLVNDLSVFKPDIVFRDCPKALLIFDDIFGTGDLDVTANTRQIFEIIRLHMKFKISITGISQGRSRPEAPNSIKQKQKRKVIFTSKTYNLKRGIQMVKTYKNLLFQQALVFDLSRAKDLKYNDEEKRNIFLKLKGVDLSENETDTLMKHMNETYEFGFPLICKLYFQFGTFHKSLLEVFTEPLQYLRRDIDSILQARDSRASILSLLLLLDRPFSPSELDREGCLKSAMVTLRQNNFSCDVIKMRDEAKALIGTYLKVEGQMLLFAHSSIYDAVACSLAERHTLMILTFCNIEFICNRIRIHLEIRQDIFDTEVDEYLNIIYITDAYHDLLVDRLFDGLMEKKFSLVLTYSCLNSRALVDKLVDTVTRDSSITSARDEKKKSFLYWTTYIKSPYLCQKAVDLYAFTRDDIVDAVLGCASNGNKEAYLTLTRAVTLTKDEEGMSLITASKHGQINIVKHLLLKGVDILYMNIYGENSMLLACEHGFTSIVKVLSEFAGGGYFQRQMLTKKAVEIEDAILYLSPVMISILHGHENILTFFLAKNTDILEETCSGNILHLAAHSGNLHIVQEITKRKLFSVDVTSSLGITPLMFACRSGRKDVYMHLVSLGGNVSHVDETGASVLHWATIGGNICIVQDVLNRTGQAFVNSSDRIGNIPILLAAACGHTEVIHLLESNGADIKMSFCKMNCLHLSCIGDRPELVNYLVQSGHFDVDEKGMKGYTSWMLAASRGNTATFDILFPHSKIKLDYLKDKSLAFSCRGGNMHIVQELLENCGYLSNINVKSEEGITPLLEAARNGHLGLIKYLISKGANPFCCDANGRNTLHYACIAGYVDVVKFLIDECKMDFHCLDRNEWTPFLFAVVLGKKHIVEYLHSKGESLDDLASFATSSGTSALHLVCIGKEVDFADTILTTAGTDINMRNEDGMTPVLCAARGGHVVTVKYLHQKGADLKITTGGNTILHFASACGNSVVIEYLLSVSEWNLNSKNAEGKTPVMVAVSSGNTDAVYVLKRSGANIHLKDNYKNNLLHLAADLSTVILTYRLLGWNNDRNISRNTPLMFSVVEGRTDVFAYLMCKCKKDLFFANGSSLLHLACSKGHESLVSYMLSQNMCDINFRDVTGSTPVMAAVQNGHADVYKLLKEKGCDLSIRNKRDQTLLVLAATAGHRGIAETILEDIRSNNN